MKMNDSLNSYKKRIDDYLDQLLSLQNFKTDLLGPIRYSVLSAGKRIRPLLVYCFGEALGADMNHLDTPAAAVELMHCYSLIHDDLPAMDNDDLRRGKPSCHKAFDEASAILSGDALQSLAFELLSNKKYHPNYNTLTDSQLIQMVQTLAQACGMMGMVGGQYLDIQFSQESGTKNITLEILSDLHQKKTGSLIAASIQLAAVTANCKDVEVLNLLQKYAKDLGLAFQIQDDILDVEGKTEILGKNAGQDAALNKQTYIRVLGLEAAKNGMEKLYQDAVQTIESLTSVNPERKERILELTNYLLLRNF